MRFLRPAHVALATLLVGAMLPGCNGDGNATEQASGAIEQKPLTDGAVSSADAPGSSGASSSSSGASSGGSGGGDGGSDGSGSSGQPPPPTCGIAGVAGGFVGNRPITVAGQSRSYELFLPPGYDGNATYPVILVFHGDGGSGSGVRGEFDLETASGTNAIIAYPNGQSGTWQIDSYTPMMRDVAFVDAVIAELAAKYCTNGRNFLAGFSKGAYFVNQVACRTSRPLRGVMSNSGGGPFGVKGSEFDAWGNLVCPSPAVAAMQVHGTWDGTVALSEGQSTRNYWRSANGCSSGTTAYAPSPCVSYNGCARPEIWCQISGMDHSVWSQSPAAAWGFFSSR